MFRARVRRVRFGCFERLFTMFVSVRVWDFVAIHVPITVPLVFHALKRIKDTVVRVILSPATLRQKECLQSYNSDIS